MHVAARFEHESIVRMLLKKGADRNAKDNKGKSALFMAINSGHESIARLLSEKGAILTIRDFLKLGTWSKGSTTSVSNTPGPETTLPVDRDRMTDVETPLK